MDSMMFTLVSMLFFIGLVSAISWSLTRKAKDVGAHGYFMASGGLTGWFIAGSMMLTNLSVEQLVGLNGDSYRSNLSSMAWEATAATATIALAMFFLPRYLKGGFTTLPEFIEKRYDVTTRRIISGLMVCVYTIVVNPAALYLGAITFNEIFHLNQILGWSHFATITLLILGTGIIGASFAVLGGLRAVAVSDTINGLGLCILVMIIPVIGLWTLGNGDILSGATTIMQETPEKLNAIGRPKDKVPFGTIFTGMIVANLFYWCTNQAIVQKSMAAKSLAEGQKGVLLSGLLKMLVPLAMLLPGVIAFHLFKDQPLANSDMAYPALVSLLMPWWMKGFFVAVIFGTIMSHFNAVINGAATLVTYDFYKQMNPLANDNQMVKFGKKVSIIVAVISIIVAPLLMYTPEGIYTVLRRFNGFLNVPIIVVMLFGFFNAKGGAFSAKLVLGLHALFYGVCILGFGLDKLWGINYLHLMGIMFVVEMFILIALRNYRARSESYVMQASTRTMDLTPWRHASSFSMVLMAMLVSIYVTFSPLGVANATGPGAIYVPLLSAVWVITFIIIGVLRARNKTVLNTSAVFEGAK